MTSLPLWAVYAVAFGSPILAFIGALAGSWLTRRSAKEQGNRSRHEEVMRNFRWAAEHAVSEDSGLAQLGVGQLNVLSESDELDDDEKGYIDAALESVVQQPAEEIEESSSDGVEVVVDDDRDGADM